MQKGVSTMLISRRVAYLFLPDLPTRMSFSWEVFPGHFRVEFFADFFL